MVAERIVQLDYQTRGRVIFGTGPGALPSDIEMLGIDPMTTRDRQDEGLGVIRRLFKGERFSYECEWFTLKNAKLQLMPLQKDIEFAVASMFSPSGMTLAGKYEAGVLSLGSMSLAGMRSLPNQWSFAEESAAKHGTIVDRKNWRILISWHIAETREKARKEARDGLLRTNNEYTVGTLQGGDGVINKTPDEAVDGYAFSDVSLAVIGTPDDLVDRIRHLQELTGGFGTVVGFVHDWANRENPSRSWDMVARYVIPEVNGMLAGYRESQKYVNENRSVWDRAAEAVKSKITENPNARAAAKEDEEAGRDFFDFNEQKEAQKLGTKS
jgi:limonene 1,2-monooxygenase